MRQTARFVLACTISIILGSTVAAGHVSAQIEHSSEQSVPYRYHDHNVVQNPERQAEIEYLQKQFPKEYMEIQRLAQMDMMLNRRIQNNFSHLKDLHNELQTKISEAKQKQPINTKELKQLEEQMKRFEDKYQRFRKSVHPYMLQLKSLYEQRRTLREEFVKYYTNRDHRSVQHVLKQWIGNGKETILVKQRILKHMQGESVL
jgi:HAMP domain-containing protein